MGASRFYELRKPEYDSDYHYIFVNGDAAHCYSLPGLNCPNCGRWSGCRILPFACPPELRSHENINDGSPIPPEAHRELRDQALDSIRRKGHSIESLEPGDTFPPAVLDIPSRPELDFLWSTIGSVLVSERVKVAFESVGFTGFSFFPVRLRRVGKAYATDTPPVPSTGEPSDIIEETEEFMRHSDVDPYFELIVTANSGRPPGTEVTVRCDICGRESFDRARRRLVMQPEMWRGHDVFFLATTLWIIITPAVRDLLQSIEATNVVILPI